MDVLLDKERMAIVVCVFMWINIESSNLHLPYFFLHDLWHREISHYRLIEVHCEIVGRGIDKEYNNRKDKSEPTDLLKLAEIDKYTEGGMNKCGSSPSFL